MTSFDSKLVRLKDVLGKRHWIPRRSFDSKLVRLKAEKLAYYWDSGSKFRFQIGAIKRFRALNRFLSLQNVSIPNWCD